MRLLRPEVEAVRVGVGPLEAADDGRHVVGAAALNGLVHERRGRSPRAPLRVGLVPDLAGKACASSLCFLPRLVYFESLIFEALRWLVASSLGVTKTPFTTQLCSRAVRERRPLKTPV